jgi:uncharacterized protein YkwD
MSRIISTLACLLCLTVGAASLASTPAFAAGTRQTRQTIALDAGVLLQLNGIRVAHGLAPLELSSKLSAAADEHTLDMVAKGYFEHNSLNGTPFSKRIEGYYPSEGQSYWSVGENLYWSSGTVDAAAGLKAWMASPEHRANILSTAWRQIGIASVSVRSAPGAFQGLNVTVITTDFGVRR